jgi:hypothetical protein
MQRVLIILANCVLLLFLLVGLPAATREQVGNLQLSHASTGRFLMFVGLGIAVAANLLAALYLIKNRKQKIVCWEWAAVFAALLVAYYGFTQGYFDFVWLRKFLVWIQNHF